MVTDGYPCVPFGRGLVSRECNLKVCVEVMAYAKRWLGNLGITSSSKLKNANNT